MKHKPLSARQKLFCQGVASGLSQQEAWIRAGYSPKQAVTAASRAMTYVNVCQYIADLQRPAEEAVRLNAEKVHRRLHDIAMGECPGQTAADSIRAIAEYNRLVGAYEPDKVQVDPWSMLLDKIRSGNANVEDD